LDSNRIWRNNVVMGTIISNNFFKIANGVFRYAEPIVSSEGVIVAYTITELLTTTGAGNWTKPTGITSVTVECWGAGGAGGGATSNPAAGGGGGGGQYARSVIVYSLGESTISYNVGAGGIGTTTTVVDGGDTTWNTTTVVAKGGTGGGANGVVGAEAAGGLGNVVGSIGDIIYFGGDASTGVVTSPDNFPFGGAGGGGAGSTGNANIQIGTIELGGDGGNGVLNQSLAGNPGLVYGGGGGGSATNVATNRAGGNGAQGIIRLSYTIPPPIDFYTGSSAAFSIRKLSESASFCMKVRRSSDDATQNIGFQSDGLIDTGSLLSFVGSDTGYVNVWYNQADIQTDFIGYTGSAVEPFDTTIQEPYIVSSGSLMTMNGKPAIFYNALAGLYAEIKLTDETGLWSTYGVGQVNDTTTRLMVRTVSGSVNIAQNIRRNTTNIESIGFNNAGGNGTDLGPSNPGTTQFIAYAQRTSANVEVYVNGATNGATAVAGTPVVSNTRGPATLIHLGFFGSTGPPSFPWTGSIQEVIHYPQDPATFNYRAGLTAALNSFYGTF